jgi:hypothetical protein
MMIASSARLQRAARTIIVFVVDPQNWSGDLQEFVRVVLPDGTYRRPAVGCLMIER